MKGASIFHFRSPIFRRAYRWGPAIFWMAGIFYFSSRRNPLGFLPSRGQRGSIDRVAHFAEYAGLLFLLYRALSRRERRSLGARVQGSTGAGEPKCRGAEEQRSGGEVSISSNPSAANKPSITIASVPEGGKGKRENGWWKTAADGGSMFHSPSSMLVSFVLALVYAVSDELHQELVPGRSFELADVGYDLAGMIAALGVIWMAENGRRKEERGRWKGENGRG